MRYTRNNEEGIINLDIYYDFNDGGLCYGIWAVQGFETQESVRHAYYDNYLPVVYNKTIDRLASDLEKCKMAIRTDPTFDYYYAYSELQTMSSTWDSISEENYKEDVQMLQMECYKRWSNYFGSDCNYLYYYDAARVANSTSVVKIEEEGEEYWEYYWDEYMEYSLVPWTTEQLFSQMKKDLSDYIAFCNTQTIWSNEKHSQDYDASIRTSDETLWDVSLEIDTDFFILDSEEYIEGGFSISHRWNDWELLEGINSASSSADAPRKNRHHGKRSNARPLSHRK